MAMGDCSPTAPTDPDVRVNASGSSVFPFATFGKCCEQFAELVAGSGVVIAQTAPISYRDYFDATATSSRHADIDGNTASMPGSYLSGHSRRNGLASSGSIRAAELLPAYGDYICSRQ